AIRLLATRAALGAEQLDALLAEHSFALNGGQSRRALDVTERLHEALPGSRAHLRLRVLDALHGDGDTAAARVAARELATHADAPSQPDAGARAIQLADACVLAQWRAAPWSAARDARDEGAIRRAVRRLRAEGIAGVPVPVGASPRACADLVEAMLAVTRGDRDARARLDALDALMLTGPALGDASSWATLALARLYERLGATQRAVSTVRQRAYMNGWPRYRASSLRVEAHLATALGDTVAASAAWRAYLALRDVPAPARRQHGERDVTSVPVLDRPVRR
ncbi:MAG: hypothetical protein MUF21_07080, partial [Gemmatimonadaceae bacterium]|nr:hypothetical protein [Gemmatimonadaceae bacterium]